MMGLRYPQHTQISSNSSTIAAESSNVVTNTRCCRYSLCAPDDGWRYRPKHVEQFPDIINCVTYLFGYILEHCGVCSYTVCSGSAVVSTFRALVNTITCAYLLAHRSCLEAWEGWSNCSEGGFHPSDMSPQRHVLKGLHYNETLRHWSSMRQHHSKISQHSETWN